jgi:hypothetical protein
MKPIHAIVLVAILFLGYAWFSGNLAQYGYPGPSGGGGGVTTVTYTSGGQAATLPIVGSVSSVINGTKLPGLTVEIYTYNPASSMWDLVAASTTSTTSGAYGKFDSGQTEFTTGQTIYIHVTGGLSSTNCIARAYDTWVQTVVGPKVADLTQISVGDIKVYVTPYSTSQMAEALFTGSMAAFGTTDATGTALDLSAGTTDVQGSLQLSISSTYASFGGVYEVPKTSKGHVARTLKSVVYAEWNISTGIIWNSLGWDVASPSSSSYKRWVRAVDRVVSYATTSQAKLTLDFWFDLSGLSNGTGVKVTVGWVDMQDWSNAIGGTSYAGSGVNVGYNFADTASFYMTIQT